MEGFIIKNEGILYFFLSTEKPSTELFQLKEKGYIRRVVL